MRPDFSTIFTPPEVICKLPQMRLVLYSLLICLVGCATSHGPDVIRIESNAYEHAFDAAIAVATAEGMKPVLLDRRNGIIVTTPAIAGSIIEPWKPIASSARQALENTLSLQRRTARFEFKPIVATPIPQVPDGALVGPDLLSNAGTDLTQFEQPLELRVWVYVERYYTRGIRRGTWSLQSETVSSDLLPEGSWEQAPRRFWVPMTRDVARERALLSSIQARLIGE